MALILLCLCGSYCKLIATQPSLVSDALLLFDIEVRQFFVRSIVVGATDHPWKQAQLSLINSWRFYQLPTIPLLIILPPFLLLALGDAQNPHQSIAVDLFSNSHSPSEVISVDSIAASLFHQRVQPKKLEDHQFSLLLEASSPANKARLLSLSAPHAASWQ